MVEWILVIIANTANEQQVKIATYPTEAACKVAQRNLLNALGDVMEGAIDKPDANGFVLGPSVGCKKS